MKLTRASTRSSSAEQIHLLEVESDADMLENESLAMDADLAEKRVVLKNYVPSLDLTDLIPVEPQIDKQPARGMPSSTPMIAWWKRRFQSPMF